MLSREQNKQEWTDLRAREAEENEGVSRERFDGTDEEEIENALNADGGGVVEKKAEERADRFISVP